MPYFIYLIIKCSFKNIEFLYNSPTCHNLNSIRKREVHVFIFMWAFSPFIPRQPLVSTKHKEANILVCVFHGFP